MLTAILLLFAAALAAPWVRRAAGGATGLVLALVPAALFAWFAAHLPAVGAGRTVHAVHPWVPALGVDLSFHLDGLSLLFALLVTGLGAVIVAYAGAYLHGHPQLGRFFLFFFGFAGSMLGLVLSDNLLALFVFWELTSITSYLLIGFDHEKEAPRAAALQALLVTGAGGLALLAGLLLLSTAAGGTMEISAITAAGDAVRGHALYGWIFALIAVGAFTKSAQVPFHFWLPNAMAAPTPVSAFLHSATMVKGGIYLLARLDPALGGTGAWTVTLSVVGTVTMLTGAVMALRQTDLKQVLAYSTLAALGTLTLLLGLGFADSVKAAIVFLLVHALYKAALFLVAGTVEHHAGTLDVLRLGGLRRALPFTAAAAALAGLSMAGLPPLFGFIGKELAYEAKLGFEAGNVLLPAAVAANALTVAAAGIVALRPFRGAPRERADGVGGDRPGLWLPPLAIALGGLVLGLYPAAVANTLVRPAVAAVLGAPVAIELRLWYGWNMALVLSVVTALLGVAFYRRWVRLCGRLARADPWMAWGPERVYGWGLDGMAAAAAAQTRWVRAGGLSGALRTVFALAAGLAALALAARGGGPGGAVPLPSARPHEWALAVLIAASTAAAITARSRLTAVVSLGFVGMSVALLYALLGAPDLAITQLLVETLTVVIVLLVVRRIPAAAHGDTPGGWARARNAVVALGAGGVMAGLLLAVQRIPFHPALADHYLRESLPSGFGANVVNVILVDFRALDTLGEITVLAAAALGAHALMRLRPRARPGTGAVPVSVIVRTTTRLLTPLLMLAAAFLLWRGHNLPGGGFIGGLVAAGAVALCVVAFGPRGARRVLRVDPRALLAAGLGTALASGLFALAAGEGFLDAQWVSVPTAGGALKLGTPLLFDLGVMLVVVGFVCTINLALEEG